MPSKICTKCDTLKDLTDFNKLRTSKDGHKSYCKACAKAYNDKHKDKFYSLAKKWKANNKEHVKEYQTGYNKTNKSKISLKHKEYREANKEYLLVKSREYYESTRKDRLKYAAEYRALNASAIKEYRDSYLPLYYLNNKSKFFAYSAKRRVTKINATPTWLSDDDIKIMEAIYKLARIKSKLTGIQYHVDHIIPLKGIMFVGYIHQVTFRY